MNSYHNTNKLEGEELVNANVKARRQEDVILDFFIKNPDGQFTAEQVHAACLPSYKHPNVPLTSTRRGLSNLSAQSYIEMMHANLVPGSYGSQIHEWKYIKPKSQLKFSL